jgi:mono/diheme cytochrome c family protein
MRRLSILTISAVCLFCGCESARYYTPPVATSEMARGRSGQDVDLASLQKGRVLFAHRCIQCHTAPAIWYYSAEDWPLIVNSMAHRASLKPAERDAIIAYILAVRAQSR